MIAKARKWTKKEGGMMPPSLFVPDLTTIRPADQASGGVRGGTIRLLPVDSKAEAKRSRLLSS